MWAGGVYWTRPTRNAAFEIPHIEKKQAICLLGEQSFLKGTLPSF